MAFPMGLTVFFLISSLFFSACEDTDMGMATQAGIDAFQAATLSHEDVIRLSREVSRRSDHQNRIAPPNSPHARRLQKLVGSGHGTTAHPFNFKVYLSPKVNAFAMGDGSIRVYSGLMDMMNDEELLFILGHEMGHVTGRHIKKKIMLTYAGSALRKAIASQQNQVGNIARSGMGAFAEGLLNAQFYQQEEREADDHGVRFLKERGRDEKPAISALMKLSTLGSNHSFLSSHPAPEARAERLHRKSLSPESDKKPSFYNRLVAWLTNLWPF